MSPEAEAALANDLVIDITTTGAKSGEPRRIEIWFHRIDGKYYITGRPGPRAWHANLIANPEFTVHLKESAQADLPATATVIAGEAEKRAVFQAAIDEGTKLAEHINAENIDAWAAESPLIEFELR